MSSNNIDYNNPLPEFEGLKFYVDAFNVRRRIQQIMPIFYEEQPLTWLLYQEEVKAFMKGRDNVKILDVGCGSGFWGLLLKKNFPEATVTCLDKNALAIERARYNGLSNHLEINLVEGFYSEKQFAPNSFDLIVLTAPYHLYDPSRTEHIPWFARGGKDGLKEFYSQSRIAKSHLKEDGMILFNQMSAGSGQPDYVAKYGRFFETGQLVYTNILPPTKTRFFLEGLYGELESPSLIKLAKDKPDLYYTSGIYHRDSQPFRASENTASKESVLSEMEQTWETRIALHREINHFSKDEKDYVGVLREKSDHGWQGINFLKAISNTAGGDCFVQSGSKLLLTYLRQQLGDDASIFLDFSAIPSSFRNDGKLADFITVCDPGHRFVADDKLEETYQRVYIPLKEERRGLFYHPYFFGKPRHSKYYFSRTNSTDTSDIDTDYKQDPSENVQDGQWLKVELNLTESVCFKNKSFHYSYEEYQRTLEATVKNDDKDKCTARNGLLHRCYNRYLHNDSRVLNSYLLSIPLIGYPGKDNAKTFEGLGAIFVYFVKESFDEDTVGTIANALWFLGLQITYNSLFRIALELSDKAKSEADKSAKAAIMSRNISHNLGSHVMAYLKQEMGDVASIMRKDSDVLKYLPFERQDVELPFLVGLGRFIGYIQERQDFIATIATDYIPYGAPVNLKDAIYDELNPDLRFLRHKSGKSSDEDKNRPMNILLSYIAKSEGLSRKNMYLDRNNPDLFSTRHDILFGFSSYSRNEDGSVKKEVFGLSPETSYSDHPALAKMREVNFCLPGGLTGRQAVFSIIENIVRNAAKHGDLRTIQNGNLCFTFDVLDGSRLSAEDDGQELQIKDRIHDSVWLELYRRAPDRDQMYLLTITDNLDYSKNSPIGEIMEGLYEDFVDRSTGRMIESNKGIKEIRISSAWLRHETDERMFAKRNGRNTSDKQMPLVAVELTEENHLRYIIALRKNRLVAVVGSDLANRKMFFREVESGFPIDWVVFDSVDSLLQTNQDPFRYIIVGNVSDYESLRPYTSNRVLIWQDSEDNEKEIWSVYKEARAILDEINAEYKDEDISALKASLKEKRSMLAQEVLTLVYRYYYLKDDEETPVFYICDDQISPDHVRYHQIRVSGESEVIQGEQTVSDVAEYMYRKHHSSKGEFISYWKKKNGIDGDNPGVSYQQIKAIDGISGANSSDRLVRREPLNEEWYYSHLHALRRRVAIFDERLFKIVHQVDENQLLTQHVPGLKDVLSELEEGTIDKYAALNKISRLPGDILKFDYESILTSLSLDTQAFINDFRKYDTSRLNPITKKDNHMTEYYAESGVDVFSIIKDEKGGFAIVGCVACKCSGEDNLFECTFDRIATISWDKVTKTSSVTFDEKYKEIFKQRYDYISIHQGLLDKIYEQFDEKESDENSIQLQESVTRSLHERFMEDSRRIIGLDPQGNHMFLPGFTIHSGRSKPAQSDFPQHLPFIQYASLEHSFKDCKYSLIEVLDYARYEGGSMDDIQN